MVAFWGPHGSLCVSGHFLLQIHDLKERMEQRVGRLEGDHPRDAVNSDSAKPLHLGCYGFQIHTGWGGGIRNMCNWHSAHPEQHIFSSLYFIVFRSLCGLVLVGLSSLTLPSLIDSGAGWGCTCCTLSDQCPQICTLYVESIDRCDSHWNELRCD